MPEFLRSYCWLMLALAVPTALAEPIKIGMTTALSGPAQALGQAMALGFTLRFDEINRGGGINGQQLQLITLDDGYEPSRAAPNMRQLIDEHNVVAVVGNVGTPTAMVTVPIANQRKTLLYGAFSGANILRTQPPQRYVINFRASYKEETAAMISGLLGSGVDPQDIAFFTQDDSYGNAGYQGALEALAQHGFSRGAELTHGRYTRNTTNIEAALADIIDSDRDPKAIIMVAAYAPAAAFIRKAREFLPDTLFLNVSFVGSLPLLQALGDENHNVIVTQVVPHFDSDLPAVKAYRNALAQHDVLAQPDFVSLEGYLAATVFVEGLRSSTDPHDREALIDALFTLDQLDIGIAQTLHLSPADHQASHRVWPTIIRQGRYQTLHYW